MNWQTTPLDRIIEEILTRHHPYVRTAIPPIRAGLAEANRRWGGPGSAYARTHAAFETLAHRLDGHMTTEEAVVFPLIQSMERPAGPSSCVGLRLLAPILQMEAEHAEAYSVVRALRRLAACEPPCGGRGEWACCLEEIAHFDRDWETHLQLENGVLFPRALAMESQLACAS